MGASAQAAPAAPASDVDRPTLPPGIDDAALAESAQHRDPFRSVTRPPTPPSNDDRHRKSKRFTVDQLKLVGVVTRTGEPRAMLVDPRGKGWIVSTGDIVGRAEVVGVVGGGDAPQTASWRVDRIRDGEVVLVRDDIESAGASVATRVLALRDPPASLEDD